jgi:uncharacterized protein YndB with AHSA1/START domain
MITKVIDEVKRWRKKMLAGRRFGGALYDNVQATDLSAPPSLHCPDNQSDKEESKMSDTTTKAEDRTLVLTRVFDATPEKLYRAWTDPQLMSEWFCPRPWQATVIENDVRPGGSSTIMMRGPEGQEFPNHGVYLDVVPNRRLVFTDAFTKAWQPSEKAFMVAEVEFEDIGNGQTRYTARARHWSMDDLKAHEQMGFHEGWSKAAEQLAEVVARL